MKQSILSKALCTTLAFLLLLQALPLSVFANDYGFSNNLEPGSSLNITEDESIEIVCEVVANRGEYSKEYLLKDGSFYSVTSPTPLHTLVDGEWVDIYSELDATNEINTTDEVLENIQNSMMSTYSMQRSSVSQTQNSTFIINPLWSTELPGGSYQLSEELGALLIKPTQIGEYFNQNKIITYAGLSINCLLTLSDSEESAPVRVCEETGTWDELNPPTNLENSFNNRIIDIQSISASGIQTWDITDLYSRWDRGATANNGVFIMLESASTLIISNPCIVVRYIEVESNDIDFTYHSLDMGYAGTLFINDYTNSVRLEQDLLRLPMSNSLSHINRIYNSLEPSYENSAGVSFNFNFESSIVLSNNYAEWKTINGSTIKFLTSNPIIKENGYYLWTSLNDIDSDESVFELWIKECEITNLNNYSNITDYRNVYVLVDGLKYNFDQTGNLVSVTDYTTNETIISITYSNGQVTEIQNIDGTNIAITYEATPIIGFSYVKSITAMLNETEPITTDDNQQLSISFLTSYEPASRNTTHKVIFDDHNQVEYTFNFNGHLIKVKDEKGNIYFFDYIESENGNTKNNLVGYRKYYSDNNNYDNTPNESLTINSHDSYKREFENESGKVEKIFYDRNFNLIVHMDSNGIYRFAEYDSNGLISSYVFEGREENGYLHNNSFENGYGIRIVPWSKDNAGTADVVLSSSEANSGKYALEMKSNNVFSGYASQTVKTESSTSSPNVVFPADKTFVFGGWGKAKNTIPKADNFFGIVIEAAPAYDNEGNLIANNSLVYETCASLSFDTCTNNEWQYKLKAFKLNEDSVLRVKLVAENQVDSVLFDDILIYESIETQNDLEGIVNTSPISYTYSNGMINSETLTWTQNNGDELLMGTSYVYENGKLVEYKDINDKSTYYTYNSRTGLLSGMGHTTNENGVLTDATSLKYDMDCLLTSTSQVITNIETNQALTLSTNYIREYGEIVEVEHNGFIYIFNYNNDGTLKNVYAESNVLTNPDQTNNRIDYSYTDNGEISVINYSNGYRVKHFSTETEYGKMLTIECYNIDSETQSEELFKSYVYKFNEKGDITEVYDSGTGITIIYDGSNYTINDSDGILYQKNTSENGDIVESYAQEYFNKTNNTNVDTITHTPSVVTYGDNDSSIKSSSVCINKNVDNFVSTFNYERSSVSDYFDRIIKKQTILEYNRPRDLSGSVVIDTDYEYKPLEGNKTSGLVSEYTSTISNVSNNNTTELSTYNRKYEYDNKGNIKFVYTENNGTITPKNYYEYDNANQLITEIDFEKYLCAHYTYNTGGNLTAKIYYNFSELVFDITNRQITTWGNETSRITYGYDTVWSDRLTNYNGTQISYDKLGNPLNFVGIDHDNAVVTGTLEWTGDLLTAFETTNDRYTYQYDTNGYRTSKTVYEKETDSNSNTYWREIYTMRYIWENGVLNGMTYSSLQTDGTRYPDQNINLVYDEAGTPVGYVTMLGVPYYFNKDINENVLSLVYTDGSKLCSFSYDSWGLPKATYHGDNFLAQAVAKLTAVFCPVTYHGYLYDYETGLYFNKGRCYSPSWGRYLNPEDPVSLIESSTNPLDANLYLFCNNNTVNYLDKTASWSRNYDGVTWVANGFDVGMNKLFSSRAFCSVFAGQIIKTYGTWDLNNGYNYKGMNSLRIASDLFAHCIGKYAQSAINKVNTCWGDGWILNNSKSNTICVRNDDENAWKYEKIWFAAADLKSYAQKEGIYITL